MAGKYGLSQGPIKGKEAEWTGIDWQGNTARSINDRPFYPHLKNISVVNPKTGPNEGAFISIPNPDFKSSRPSGDDKESKPMSDAEFKQSLSDSGATASTSSSADSSPNKTNSSNKSSAVVGTTAAVTSVAAQSKKDQEVQIPNIKRYAFKIYKIPVADFTMDKLVTEAKNSLNNPPTVDQKEATKNFDEFVKRFAVMEEPPTAAQMKEYNDMVAWAGKDSTTKPVGKYTEQINKSLSAYKKLKIYSTTIYGAQIIKKINSDKNIYSEKEKAIVLNKITNDNEKKSQDKKLITFKLVIGDTGTAGGSPTYLILPPKFPKMDFFPGGEVVDSVAVIHHEFGHTLASPGKRYGGSLIDERNLVVNIDNPARIINGKEPRYTYYDSTTKQTINIINSSVTGDGKMTFDPKDASKLIERTPEQAKIWGVFK